jgi:hypothetical protein
MPDHAHAAAGEGVTRRGATIACDQGRAVSTRSFPFFPGARRAWLPEPSPISSFPPIVPCPLGIPALTLSFPDPVEAFILSSPIVTVTLPTTASARLRIRVPDPTLGQGSGAKHRFQRRWSRGHYSRPSGPRSQRGSSPSPRFGVARRL